MTISATRDGIRPMAVRFLARIGVSDRSRQELANGCMIRCTHSPLGASGQGVRSVIRLLFFAGVLTHPYQHSELCACAPAKSADPQKRFPQSVMI
jgi:hypothetical protein